MLGSVARKLQRSIKGEDPYDPDWFSAALTTAMDRKVGLDLVIWEAVRELLTQQETKRAA